MSESVSCVSIMLFNIHCVSCFVHAQVILPTCLRDFVPAVHWALLTTIFTLRQLDGQVLSELEAKSKNVLPGSRILEKRSLPRLQLQMILGLVMIEGSFPACHLNPLLHRFVHYPRQSAQRGILGWLAMWVFERMNQKVKNLVRNRKTPLSSIASNIQLDIAARFIVLASDDDPVDVKHDMNRLHTCYLKGRSRFHV